MPQKLLAFVCLVVLSFPSLSCSKKDDTTPAPVIPTVKIENASLPRSTTDGTMHFNLSLDKTTSVPVSVDYTLSDGTATSPKDYTATTGTVTIPANQSTAEVAVPIKGDATDTRQDNLNFTVQLSNPKGCTLGTSFATGIIITEDGKNFVTDNAGYTTPLAYPGYT
ncbi:MAG TPA: Calx-beta domain-containing protein, partial [Flavisolibacter sp.]|nr:Calx-beta domain-containing protein [Flavisolibacter sp.]